MEGQKRPARIIGRYAVYDAIAAGGMATVHFGRLLGPVGFSRTVAIKRLHPQYASDPEFVSMFLDEARLAARIRHPHVVPTLDVVATEGELFLVMDYVPGESLSRLLRAVHATHENIPPRIAIAIMSGVLQGLHAAHEAKNERGEPLGIVHRDVSPQNVLVGSDGQSRVLDFGVAKAAGRVQTTREGQLKGKISYMAPEQLGGMPLDRRSDVFSASVVLWEALTGERLFAADNEGAAVARVLDGRVEPPSQVLARQGRVGRDLAPHVLEQLDAIVLRGLASDPNQRFQSAHDMAVALEDCIAPATTSHVAHWIQSIASAVLAERAAQVADIESSSIDFVAYPAGSVSPSSPSASSNPILEAPTVAMPSSPSNPIPEPSSQLSSISAVNTTPPQRTSKRWRIWVAVGSMLAGVLVLAAIVVGFAIIKGRSRSAPVTASAPPSVALGSVSAVPSAPSSSSASAGETSEIDAAPPAPTASTRKRISRPPPSAPKPACNPPYTWDAEGHKHYKPECL